MKKLSGSILFTTLILLLTSSLFVCSADSYTSQGVTITPVTISLGTGQPGASFSTTVTVSTTTDYWMWAGFSSVDSQTTITPGYTSFFKSTPKVFTISGYYPSQSNTSFTYQVKVGIYRVVTLGGPMEHYFDKIITISGNTY